MEQWKPYPEDRRYEVSNMGRIRTAVTLKIRKPQPLKGSKYLTLVFSSPTGHKCRYVHRMVLETWAGPCPDGHQASHLDGNRQHNAITNLVWETPVENHARKILHGTHPVGEKGPSHVLTWDRVTVMRREFVSLIKRLAVEHGVSKMTVRRVLTGESWPNQCLPGSHTSETPGSGKPSS